MERFAKKDLVTWKLSQNRKPLIVQGARQVGKTWLIKEFGSTEYKQLAYVNFESSGFLKSIFVHDFDIDRIISAIQIETGIRIQSENTLIFFDEIQEAERGITALKYFYENAPQYHIVAAGSLLGTSLHAHTSFPVGKVDLLKLHPMNFGEFLIALHQEQLYELLCSQNWDLISTFKSKYINLLRQYYFVGGMPEAVFSFSHDNDFERVRIIQKNLLFAYENDFSKHAPAEIVPRIRMLWNSVLSQLSRENKKFIYGAVKHGGRAKEFELALSWLVDSGLLYQVHRISKPAMPLASYKDISAFKLFLLDVGLLAAMGDLDSKTLLAGNEIFLEFKGSLTEQYVFQQLRTKLDSGVFYWTSGTSSAEVDFVIQWKDKIIPVEVKAEENLQAKSLKSYHQQYKPEISIRTSMSDYRQESWLVNIPLYAIDFAAEG
jgi:hypothetical protein